MPDIAGQDAVAKGMSQEGSSRSFVKAFFRGIGIAVDRFEVVSLSAGVALLAVLLIANVIAREFFHSIYFTEEISKFLVIFVTFVGISYAARKARHIRMGAFMDMMGPRLEKAFIYGISAVNSIVMFVMTYYSLTYMLASIRMQQTSEALRLPYWIFIVIVPIGFFLTGIQYIRTIAKNIVEKDPWLSPEQKSEYEDEQTAGGGY